MRIFSLFLITTILWATQLPLKAEIQKITVYFNNVQCNQSCGGLLERRFREIKGVQDVRMNVQGGNAQLIWSPNFPYEYFPIHAAMSWVGLHIDNMTVQLRGTISHSGSQFYVTSLADGTRFQLLGSLITHPNQFTQVNNTQSYKFDEDTKNKLLDAESQRAVVDIQGIFFMPWQAITPQRIILSNFSAQKVD